MTGSFLNIKGHDITDFDVGAADMLCAVPLPKLYPPNAAGTVRVTYSDRTDKLAGDIDLCDNIRKNCQTLVTLTPKTEIPISVLTRVLRPAIQLCDETGDDLTQHVVLRYPSDKQPPDDILPHAQQLYRDFRVAQDICRITNGLRARCEPDPVPDPITLPNRLWQTHHFQ